MPPALIGAGIAGAATIGGAVISSHAQSKAADQAQAAQDQATQAQLQLGQQSMDLQKQVYGSNYDTLSPFVARGNVAGDAINALLGLAPAPKMVNPLGSSAMNGSGSGAGNGTAPSSPSTLSEIAPLQNDGIPGNYRNALTQYYQQHPPTASELAAMKNDGIPGNYAAATGQAPSNGGGLLHDIASVGGFGLAGLAATGNTPRALTALSPAIAALRPQTGVQNAPTVSQTPVASNLQQQAQQAIAAGADPAAVNARLAQLQTGRVY